MLAAGFGDPVLVVRPHSARPPDGSGRTVGKRRPTLGHPLAVHSEPSKGFRRRIGFDSLSDFDRWCARELAIYGSRHTAVVPGDRRTIGAWPNRGFRAIWSRRSLHPMPMVGCPPSYRRTVTSTHLHAMREPCTDEGRINCRSRRLRPQILRGVRCLALPCGWLSSR